MMAESPPPPAAAGKLNCPACGKQTPSGFSFCQHCGQRLGAPAPAAASASAARAVAPAQVNPTPPAGLPRASVQQAVARAQAQVNNDDAMAKTMAPTPELQAAVRALSQARMPAQQQSPAVEKKSIEPYKPDTLVEGSAAPAQRFGSLVAVNRDGTDGATVEVTGETFDIGRTDGSLNFAEDPYLAPRHARLLTAGGKVTLRPIDSVNGVYLRVHGANDLAPGDQFLVGKELLRYEPLAAEERDPPSLVEHGVRFFGSSPREAWGRLRQLTVSGTTRDIWHLVRPELVLGREEGDVTFPDDEFMSRRHAAVKRVGAKAKLEDLNSSNGTYLRIRGDRELKPGDILRMGDQLMRFEP
jgi:pSer/pThr/pTyr-binding forkhead associated (FHA) protein